MPKRDLSRALLRYAVISKVKSMVLRGIPVSQACRQVASQPVCCPSTGKKHTVSERSIYRWLGRYEGQDIEDLKDEERASSLKASWLSAELLEFFRSEKTGDPCASSLELIRRAKARGILACHAKIPRSSVYRICKKMGLPVSREFSLRTHDMRRFSFPHRMDLVMCDGKHFRAGPKRRKRVAIIFIDDFSRMTLAVAVGPTENTDLFLKAFDKMCRQFGFPDVIYFDHGSAFFNKDTTTILARLKIKFVYGKKGYAEGRGKIERFNRTLKADLLRCLDGRDGVDDSCAALELRIHHYLTELYGKRPHESLAKDMSPWTVFFSDEKPLSPIDEQKYRNVFLISERRRVSKDNVVMLDGIPHEMPSGYALRKVEILRDCQLDRYLFQHEEKQTQLRPLDPVLNSDGVRSRPRTLKDGDDVHTTNIKSAADLFFEKDFNSPLDEDGNYKPKMED